MIARPYLDITVEPDGNLKVAADAEALEWIAEERARDRTDDDILWDGTEGYWNNGAFWPFDAGDANPFVGLSSAPCIAEAMDVADDGTKSINGRFWFYGNYQIKSFVDEIIAHGFVIFIQA